jgi:signal transduction histidine kinase/CheY-like chemotaxis protein
VGAVLRTGKPAILADIPDELIVQGAKDERHLRLIRSLGLKSYICVPLIVSGQPWGILTFATAESGRRYTEADLALAMDLANRAAVAIENNRLYYALREADRRKDEFLATLAHELRNPLAPVRNALEMLKQVGSSNPAAQGARAMMARQLAHMARLIDDLMDVSRITRGKLALRKEKVDLSAIIRDAADVCRSSYAERCHDIRITLPPQPLQVHGDPVRLEQVIGNLLNNACKYTDPGGLIEVQVAADDSHIEVSVKDNGIGISSAMLPKVFDMFTQAQNSSDRAGGGLGIGLSLVKYLVELHNGTIAVHSEGEGRGSKFILRLPALVEKPAAEEPPSIGIRPAMAGKRRRILVVDDNKDAARSLAMLLKLQGHEIQMAGDGEEAVQRAVEFNAEVILLDIGLPKLNGYDACRAIRKLRGDNQPVVFALTGWGQEEDRRRSKEAGFDSHIVKPVDYQALVAMLESLSSGRNAGITSDIPTR